MNKKTGQNAMQTYSLICTMVFFSHLIYGQTPINVIQANHLEQIVINDTIFQKFSGNVIIEYSDLEINCDTILIDEYKILMKGWGNTKIVNDTIHCTTDSVNIFQLNNIIVFYQNTTLKTDSMIIYSDELQYNYKTKQLIYLNGGSIQLNDQNINSNELIHDLNTGVSHFNQKVYLKSLDYDIETESMKQNKDTISFSGETLIKNDEFNINCSEGFFKKHVVLKLKNNVRLHLENETIKSEELERDIANNINYFTYNVHMLIDKETHVLGEKLIEIDSVFTMTNDCEIQLLTEKDSTYITGDTITMNKLNKDVKITNNVIITGRKLDGNCKLMEFTSEYKTIEMFTNPVLWFSDIQITGEKIILFRKNNQLDSMYIPQTPFIISPYDSLNYYNQIKGKNLESKLKGNTIDYMKLNGNGKMKYFDNNKKSTIEMNNIESGNIKILFHNNKVKSVLCFDQVESNHIEIDHSKKNHITPDLLILDGFQLRHQIKE